MSLPVISFLEPAAYSVGYILEDIYLRGGYRVVYSEADRDAISPSALKDGMLVYTQASNKIWLRRGGVFAELPISGSANKTIIVASQTSRYALTPSIAQNGDIVLQTDENSVWIVTNNNSLNNQYGYTSFLSNFSTFGQQLGAAANAADAKTLLGISGSGFGNTAQFVVNVQEMYVLSGLHKGDMVYNLEDKSVSLVSDETKTYSSAGYKDLFGFMSIYGKHLAQMPDLNTLKAELSVSPGNQVYIVLDYSAMYALVGTVIPGDLVFVTTSTELYIRTSSGQFVLITNLFSQFGYNLASSSNALAARTLLELGAAATMNLGTSSTTVSAGNHVHIASDIAQILFGSVEKTVVDDSDLFFSCQNASSGSKITFDTIKQAVFSYLDSIGALTYEKQIDFAGSPEANQRFGRIIFGRSITFSLNLAGCYGRVDIAPTSNYVITLTFKRLTTTLKTGTITINSSGTFTFALSTELEVVAGDYLEIVGPASASAIQNITFILTGKTTLP